jgi:hypothetical protein
VFRLASRAKASRHGIDCWHGSPRHPLLGFLTEGFAGKILPDRPVGSLGLVGHTHEPALFAYVGAATRAVRPVPGESYDWLAAGACVANPGAVCGNPRDAASWWLIIDIDARVLRWHRTELTSEKLALLACEPRRSHRRVTRVRHREQSSFQGTTTPSERTFWSPSLGPVPSDGVSTTAVRLVRTGEISTAGLTNRLPAAVAAWLPNEVLAVGSRRGLARKRREHADSELQSDMPTTVPTRSTRRSVW